MNNKLKIYFYSPGFMMKRPVRVFANRDQTLFINPTPMYLDSYVRANHPELVDRIEWTKIQYLPLTQQELVDEIDALDVDVVAFSVYTWNDVKTYENIKGLDKLTKKPVKFIIGGPGVNVVRDPSYLLNLPEIDFAIYAQGEVPFVSVVKHYLGIEKISLLKTKNIAWVKDGKVKKADYEFTRITRGSPIVESRHLLEQVKNDPDLAGWLIHFPYETSRGCPYSCSFCDWTSGLSHKVSKRKFAYEEELDTLGQLGITDLYMADANFGLFPEDVGIAETMARLKQEKGYNFYIHGNNFSKTKKDVVFKIADIFASAEITPYMKFSIQDIDDGVLKNIDRPDISWNQHIQYIMELRKKHPTKVIALDIIKGLPGQTRESWERLFSQVCQYNLQLDVYDWQIISNSPAGYDKEYQLKMQLDIDTTLGVAGEIGDDVLSTYSYTREDYSYFSIVYTIYNLYFRNVVPAFPRFIGLIKQSDRLDYYINEITKNIKTKEIRVRLAKEFMDELVQSNYNLLTKSFVKQVFTKNRKFGLSSTQEDHLVNIDRISTTDDLILRVFTSL